MENNISQFSSKRYHLLPFYRGWCLGFVERNRITISDSEITVDWEKGSKTLPIKELEFCIKEERWFGLGVPRIKIGANGSMTHFYMNDEDEEKLFLGIKQKNPICFSPNSEVIYTSSSSLWLNEEHIISSKNIPSYKFTHYSSLNINELKYFYTKGVFSSNLYVGTTKQYLRLDNVDGKNVEAAQKYISIHGGKIASEAEISYTDCFTLNVIFSPSLWFAHSSIGFTKDGIVYKQKTFKTNDNIFLPYEKVNLATYESKWHWFGTKRINIFGEQNIMPKRSYSYNNCNAIAARLDKEGVGTLNGTEYSPSYHSSWFGIFMSIITLGIYHGLVALFSGRKNTMVVGEKRMAWNGKVYAFTADREDHFERKEMKNLSTVVLEGSDIRSIVYIKKHWYHWWGYLFIWAHPSNIRTLTEEASQYSVDYDLEMRKVWSGTVSSLKDEMERAGFVKDKKRDKFYKKWAKRVLMRKD